MKIRAQDKNKIIAISIYLILFTLNSKISRVFEIETKAEWWINTSFLLIFTVFVVITFNVEWKIVYKILILPGVWIVHAIFTIPATTILGIIKYDPGNLRTAGEHRAVFIFASIPILIFLLNKSKFFISKDS